jgi:uncharacterized membrane protein YphA (DoxX/SURF4 family)
MGSPWERYLLLWMRVYLGAFNFVSGVNYFVLYWPQPKVEGSDAGAAYVQASMDLHLFALAKVIEAVCGLMLLSNVAVPLALLLLMPVTVTIFIMNGFYSPLPHIKASGTRNMLFHVILLISYAGQFLPILKLRPTPSALWRKSSVLKDFL